VKFPKLRIFYAIISLIILLLPLLSLAWSTHTSQLEQNITRLPYILSGIGLVLCLVFYNSREFNLLLILGASYWSLQYCFWSTGFPESQRDILFDCLCVLIPFNFAAYNFFKERGILNQYGAKRLAFLTLQILLVYWLVLSNMLVISSALDVHFFTLNLTIIKQPALLVMVTSLLILLAHWVIQGSQLRYAWILALACIMLALHHVNYIYIATIYFILAEFIIIVALITNSYNLAYKDELTQLPSRRALKQKLATLGRNYAIAMVDVDHFKKLNDTYGHDVGDDVLKMLAVHLQEVEGGGKIYRYGGEEFIIVFPGKDAKSAAIFLEALRVKIDSTPFIVRHKKRPRKKPEKATKSANTKQLNVTVSIGVASKQEIHLSPQDVTKSADNALYKAKKNGRNQVAINFR